MGFDENDLSGIDDSTTYWFIINDKEYSINNPPPNTGANFTYAEVINLVNALIVPDGFEALIIGDAPSQKIRIYNFGVKGIESSISIQNGVSGTSLWSSLDGYTPTSIGAATEAQIEIEITPVSGDLGYIYNNAIFGRGFFRGE